MRSQRPCALAFTALAGILTLTGCDENGTAPPRECEPPRHAYALVVNGLAETLGLVVDGAAAADPCEPLLGDFPNDVAIDPSGSRALVVDSGDNDVAVVELEGTLRVSSRIDFGVGTNPFAVVWRDDESAFVTLLLTGEVVEVDVSSGDIVSRDTVGTAPQPLLLTEDNLLVGVTNYVFPAGWGPGEVAVIDLSSGDVVRKIPVGLNPQHLALAPDGRVHVVCTGDYAATPGRIYVLDKDVESVVDSVLVGGSPLSVAITPSGKGYIGANFDGLLAYDALSLAITAPIGAPVLAEDGIFDVALDPSGSRLVVTDFGADALYFLDTDTDSVTATVTVGDGPLAVAYRP